MAMRLPKMLSLKGYTRYNYEKNNLNGIPKVFLVFSLITKVTNCENTNIYWISLK